MPHTLNLMKSEMSDQARWKACLNRDADADGAFVLAVRTTGIYCRPTCPARKPKRQNVEFFAGAVEAERAGYRACKRCAPKGLSPLDLQQKTIEAACIRIKEAEDALTLENLAAEAGISPFHFHRLFRDMTGVTPKQYAKAKRRERFAAELKDGGTVTEAIYGAGYGSSSRFYEKDAKTLGMTPAHYKKGGAGLVIYYTVSPSPLGPLVVGATDKGVCAIQFADDPDEAEAELQDRFPEAELVANDARLKDWVATVIDYLDMPKKGLSLPLDIQGTAFQHRVWQALQDIPVGELATYSDIAQRIGAPRAVRAVGTACGANKIALAIPCHRVVGKNGGLTGYRWGVGRKKKLIHGERG